MNTRRNKGSSRKSNRPKSSSKSSESNFSSTLHAQHSLATASGIISQCLVRAANIFSSAADQLDKINLDLNDSCTTSLSEGTHLCLIRPCSVPISPCKEPTTAHTTSPAFGQKRRALQSPTHETESSISSSLSIEPTFSSKRPRNSSQNSSASKSRSARLESDTSSNSSYSPSVSSSGSGSTSNSEWASVSSANNTLRKSSLSASTKQTRALRVSAGASRTRSNAASKAKRVKGDSSISSSPLRLRSAHK